MITADEARRFSAPNIKSDLAFIDERITAAAVAYTRNVRVEFENGDRLVDEVGGPSAYCAELLIALRDLGFKAEFGRIYMHGYPEIRVQW